MSGWTAADRARSRERAAALAFDRAMVDAIRAIRGLSPLYGAGRRGVSPLAVAQLAAWPDGGRVAPKSRAA